MRLFTEDTDNDDGCPFASIIHSIGDCGFNADTFQHQIGFSRAKVLQDGFAEIFFCSRSHC